MFRQNSNRFLSFLFFFLQGGWTALMIASQNGHTEIVQCLIEAKTSPDLLATASCVSIDCANPFTTMCSYGINVLDHLAYTLK